MRSLYRQVDRHIREKQTKLAGAVMNEAKSAAAEFEWAVPTTPCGSALKAAQAEKSLAASQDYVVEDKVRLFFRTQKNPSTASGCMAFAVSSRRCRERPTNHGAPWRTYNRSSRVWQVQELSKSVFRLRLARRASGEVQTRRHSST